MVGVPFAAMAIGFLLGSIPFGLLLTRMAGLGDIRAIGSGNIGATNVLRSGRRDLAAATLILDAAKGTAAALLATRIGGDPAWAGLAAVLGHTLTPWLRFRGGKGVATGLGALIGIGWPLGLVACGVWLLAASVSRISSVAAICAFAVAGAAGVFDPAGMPVILLSAWVIYRHRANMGRLMAGTEPRIGK